MIGSNPYLLLFVLLYLFSIAFYNFLGLNSMHCLLLVPA